VVTRPSEIAERSVGVAEPGVRSCLLVGSVDLVGMGQCGGVVAEGVGGLLGEACCLAEAVERPGLAVPVADLPEGGQGFAVVVARLGGSSGPVVGIAEAGQ
jgi:hypothetical protein